MPILERDRPVKEKTAQPRYQALAAELRGQILRRELMPGDRLPSFSQLRARHGATPTTAERVYGVLEQEGLVERRQGSGTYVLERKKVLTGNIGYIGSEIAGERLNPFRTLVMAGVHREIDKQERHLLYMGNDDNLKIDAVEKVDGVLICNIEDTASVIAKLPAGMPRVSLLNVAPDTISVVADDVGGGRKAVEKLMELGHRRIACLMEKTPSLPRRRLAGYHDAMLHAGIDPNPRWIRLTGKVPTALGLEQTYLHWARQEMRDWLASDWEELGCTAIVVQNEEAAIGVLQVLQEAGIQVPQQVSVVGFDGTEMCEMVIPRLSTVQLPLMEVGGKGVQILTHLIEGEAIQTQTIVLPVYLRERDSIAPPL